MPASHHAPATGGARLALLSDGEETDPPLLLIPGLGAAASVFDPIVPHLAATYHVLRYDPRGVGESTALDGDLSMETMVGDAISALHGFGVHSAHTLGASMGGVIAQHMVLSHPDAVDGLILAATALGGRKAIPPDPRATDALMGKGARTPAEAYRRACTVLYSPHFQRTHEAFIAEQVAQRAAHPVRPRVFTAQLAALAAAPDIGDRLAEIEARVLVTHGTADAVTPVENARLLAARIPGAQARLFEDCGHLFFHERPQESARVIHEFLREGGADRR